MTPSESWILKCEKLEFRMISQENLVLWLQKTIPNLKNLIIQNWEISGIFDMEVVRNVKKFLKFSRDAKIKDEQLEKILTPSIVIISNGTLTEIGAKKAFKKFVENASANSRFELRFSIPKYFAHKDLFDKNWILEQTEPLDDTVGHFMYHITGGFINIHGVKTIENVQLFDFSTHMILEVFRNSEPVEMPGFY